MLKNDICITIIGQAILKVFLFKMGILRKGLKIRSSLKVSINNGEQ